MKPKKLQKTTMVLSVVLAFFLGRESKGFNAHEELQPNYGQESYKPYFLNGGYYDGKILRLVENDKDTVYRCGKSKIYHPTLKHGSFKICRSRITKLTVGKAKRLGMRRCKCSD